MDAAICRNRIWIGRASPIRSDGVAAFLVLEGTGIAGGVGRKYLDRRPSGPAIRGAAQCFAAAKIP
jgi:hypothetical protein